MTTPGKAATGTFKMSFRMALFGLMLALGLSVSRAASFERDVVRKVQQSARFLRQRANEEYSSIQDSLLSKAVPLEEYKAQLEASGAMLVDGRELEDGENAAGDDYYMDEDSMYSFSGWSLKYSKCQAIQRFSEDAVQNGEYSALVIDDVVILRLCPRRVCSSSSKSGCHYNYAEYAIGLSEYLKIMLHYKLDKKRNLCNFCAACGNRRLDEDREEDEGEEEQQEEENDRDEEDNEQEDEQQEEEKEEDNQDEDNNNEAANGDDAYYAGDDGYNDDGGNTDDGCGDCCTYQQDCYDISSWCDAESDDGVYLDILDYLDYLDCVQLEGQGNYEGDAYWVRPYCDASKGVIKMHLFQDPYCSQALKEVNLNDFSGMYFQSSMFEDFYSGECIDCSESNDPPYYNAGSYMCNKMHYTSAKCTSNMVYDLFDGTDENSQTECSFIESINFGTYDVNGAVSTTDSDYGYNVDPQVTPFQKAFLAISIVACFALGVYSCYLHHSITNLLIKSLSHSTLLPPVKRRSRNSNSRAGSRSGSARGRVPKPSKYDDYVEPEEPKGTLT